LSLSRDQQGVAATIYGLALKAGLSPMRARELVAAAYAESTLNPRARNPSGASGLFQLLSSGYQQRAKQLGGLYDVEANTKAILPNYVSYWRSHPNARPGEAGRDVEISGEGADFYARPLSVIGGSLGGAGAFGDSQPAVVPRRVPVAPLSEAQLARMNRSFRLDALPSKYVQAPIEFVQAPRGMPRVRQAPTPGSPVSTGLAAIASRQLGQPYVWGAESRKEGGFDCSGLVDWALRQQGYTGPRTTTWTIARMGRSVKGQPLQPGDLVLANNNRHVVIYAGNGRVIAAPHTGTVVQYQPISKFNITDVRRL
jgi:cell wall-associated NlpC family hydrolase